MPRRQSPTQRIVEFFMDTSLAEAKQRLDMAKALVAIRERREAPPAAERKPRRPRAVQPTEPAA